MTGHYTLGRVRSDGTFHGVGRVIDGVLARSISAAFPEVTLWQCTPLEV